MLSARLTDGTIQVVDADFDDLFVGRTTGLMSLAVDPNFSVNRRFYTHQGHTGPQVQVVVWTIDEGYTEATRVVDPLIGDLPVRHDGFHGSGRLRFGPQGYLWIATGDAGSGTVAQDLASLGGKVLRVDASTGAGAPGNPFVSSPLVYTYGHRNPQGLTRRPSTSQMWSVEHGPNIDDEINRLVKGGNYGWDPVPAYNESVPMTDLAQFPDAVEAKWASGDPTLATSGGIFLDGDDWDEWEGRLAIATLKASELHIFDFAANGTFVSQVVVLELDGTYGRLRTPMMGPDGALYLTTSNGSGDRILKVVPSLPPTFPGETDTQAVDENRSASTIVATVTATDPEGQALTYTLSGPDAASFNLASAARGQLRANSSLDHETRSSYEVIVTASDPYGLSDSVTLTITVTDVDEPPDITFAATGGVTVNNNELSVDENYDGTLATFSARDPENKPGLTYTWSLGGTDRLDFAITDAGVLSFGAIPDYERPADAGGNNLYEVVVEATDSNSKRGELHVDVIVRNVDEPPIITGPDTVDDFPENSATSRQVGRYTASDPEGASVNLSLSSGSAEFALAGNGVLTFEGSPDYEDQRSYSATRKRRGRVAHYQ